MKRCKALCIWVVLSLILSGCWDETQIAEANYATAIGVDYVDDNYVLYVQMLDFSNVAKQDNNKQSDDPPLFIGKSSGRTFHEAINNLYKTSQEPFHWGQIGAIIYSEAVLENGIDKVQQAIQRNGEFRYTPWMFGTKESIRKVLGVSGFFHLPPIYTILYSPKDSYNVHSFIRPLRMHKFISINNDPGGSVTLPSIAIDDSSWKELANGEKPKDTLKINGGFHISESTYVGWMSFDDLQGLRWIESSTQVTPVKIIEDGKNLGIIEINNPSINIQQIGKGTEVTFHLKIRAKGKLAGLTTDLPQAKIEKLAEKQIKEDILMTYEKALNKQIDIYNLKNKLFRNGMKPEHIKKYELTTESISKVEVTVHLDSKGMYK
ncbi:Ger(x)C family spore germination protein [Lederbergia graminis]|uniref:Ger(X)C family spore germination protein n=1 Tax=Lederbergia graminis TaxID=735518 RepID=A0ABW0LKK1_9BACI